MKFILLFLISFSFASHRSQTVELVKDMILDLNEKDSVPQYSVRFSHKMNIVIDGFLDDKDWEDCEVITPLYAPWEPDMKDRTCFRACYDTNYFYFSFRVYDQTITHQEQINERSVAAGDRVEMFFSADSSMSDYYCLEISPDANILDYQASYHRIFNRNWNIKDAFIKAKSQTDTYCVEGKIPIIFFKRLANISTMKGTNIRVGIFRADKKTLLPNNDFTWFSWINLKTEFPDFHIPAALGLFKF